MLGCLQNKVQLLRLWYHESCRVFRDRLVNEEDRSWFDKLLESHMEEWEVAFDEVCPFQPILYGDFMSPGSDVKSYELITSEKKVRGPNWCPTSGGGVFTLHPWDSGSDAMTRVSGHWVIRPAPGLQASICLSESHFLTCQIGAAGPTCPIFEDKPMVQLRQAL